MFKKNGVVYSTKEEYAAENTIDHQIHKARQKRINNNIDKDLKRYIKREKRKGCLKLNP